MKIITSLLIFLSLGCKGNHRHSENLEKTDGLQNVNASINKEIDTTNLKRTVIKPKNEVNNIVPDTTINNKMFLSNEKSLCRLYADCKSVVTIDKIRESPVVLFTNQSKTEYLIAYQYEGGIKNAFDCFEIGYLKNEQSFYKVNIYKTLEENFVTETNIGLGTSLEKLKSIKGTNYEKTEKENLIILTYRNADFETSSFLKRYNMPSYFMEFTLKENRIEKIKFGFDYP
jgi:hypothetical protein